MKIDLKDDQMNEDMSDIVGNILDQLTLEQKLKLCQEADKLTNNEVPSYRELARDATNIESIISDTAYQYLWYVVSKTLEGIYKPHQEVKP